jgi:hypothetical protein
MRLPFLLYCLLPLPALAAGPRPVPEPNPSCRPAIAAAEREGRLPHGLLLAIAQVESGRPDPRSGRLDPWPWTVDAEGVGQFFASRAEAVAAVRTLQARGVRSIDVGCLQINLQFHPAAFASLEQAFDPRANASYAARFLNSLHAARHDWKPAIAAYHSETPVLGADYRERVLALWKDPGRSGEGLGLAIAYRDFLPRHELYADFMPRAEVYGAFAPTLR